MPKINRIILNGVDLDFADETARSLCEGLRTDVQRIFDEITSLPAVAHTGNYNDLLQKPVIDSTLSDTSKNAVENKAITDELNKKVNESGLSVVAFSGNYEDLERKPNIPSIVNTLDSESTTAGLSAKQGKELDTKINSIGDVILLSSIYTLTEEYQTLTIADGYTFDDFKFIYIEFRNQAGTLVADAFIPTVRFNTHNSDSRAIILTYAVILNNILDTRKARLYRVNDNSFNIKTLTPTTISGYGVAIFGVK